MKKLQRRSCPRVEKSIFVLSFCTREADQITVKYYCSQIEVLREISKIGDTLGECGIVLAGLL